MKKFTAAVCGIALTGGLAAGGPARADDGAAGADPDYTYDLSTLTTTDPHAQALLAELDAALPGWREAGAKMRAMTPGTVDVEAIVEAAINPGDYECAPTSFHAFADQALADVDPGTLFIITALGALNAPRLDARIYGTEADPEYAVPGDVRTLEKSWDKAEHFWSTRTDDIRLIGAHNEMVVDKERGVRLAEVVLGLPPDEADFYVSYAISLINADPGLAGGDNPIFTLNAWAFTDEFATNPPFAGTGDAIILGEGLAEWDAFEGADGEYLQMALAHEGGHHVQYEVGIFDPGGSPELNRRSELMADAFAAYVSAHRTGLNVRRDDMMLRHQSLYEVGGCDFDNSQHHGTPNQRLAAAEWGASLAIEAHKQGHPISPEDLVWLFDQQLPILVAPDAP